MDKDNYMKGAIHIHTEYSNDSDCSLKELAKKARDQKYDFFIVTDHFEDVQDPHLQQRLIDDCRRTASSWANKELNIIPGVEVRFEEKAHILVIGIKNPIDPSKAHDLESLRIAAKEQGALIGVAHLCYSNVSPEELAKFDFVEAWNIKHDMKFPSPKILKKAQSLPNTCITGGLDLHSIDEFGSIWIEADGNDILEAIRQRRIVSRSCHAALDSFGHIINDNVAYYLHYFPWLCAKRVAYLSGQIFVVTGLKPPEILKKIKKRLIG